MSREIHIIVGYSIGPITIKFAMLYTTLYQSLFIVTLLSFSALSFAQTESEDRHLTEEYKRHLIMQSKELIENNYVYPKKAKRYGKKLVESFNGGEFDKDVNVLQFSTTLTKVLQRVSKDLHFNAWPVKQGVRAEPDREITEFVFWDKSTRRSRDWVVREVRKYQKNIGYFKLLGFQEGKKSKENIDAAMKLLESSEAIIIDLRPNYGGSPKRVKYLASYFFEEAVLLSTFYSRPMNEIIEFWSLSDVSGMKRPKVPLYILIDKSTISAGEGFSYALQALGRAIIIGQPSAGAAHPGRPFEVEGEVNLFISTGRPINPSTKTNWEGVGVQPDYVVESEKARAKAIELAVIEVKRMRGEAVNEFQSIGKVLLDKTREFRERSATGEDIEMEFVEFIAGTLASNDIDILEIRDLIERQDALFNKGVKFLSFLDKYIIHLNYENISLQ